MELSGLVFAVIVGAIVFYVAPARIAKRHAVTTSREGDRFHQELSLVNVETGPPHVAPRTNPGSRVKSEQSLGTRMPSPSTRPILASQGTRGANMSDSSKSETTTEETVEQPIKLHPAREYAALRARREARRANEKAAAQRRVISLAFASFILLVFTGLAASGNMSWGWLALPGAAMIASVASSMLAASRTRNQDAADAARLAELKGSLANIRKRQSGKSAPASRIRQVKAAAKSSVVTGRSAVIDAHWKPVEEGEDTGAGDSMLGNIAAASDASARGEGRGRKSVSDQPDFDKIVLEGPFADKAVSEDLAVEETLEEEALIEEEQKRVAKDPAASETASQQTAPKDSSTKDAGAAGGAAATQPKTAAQPQKDAPREGWDVVSVPPPVHSLKPKVKGRAVHPDTDLVEVVSASKQAAVPMRPIRKSAPRGGAAASVPAAKESGIKFDLDSVLEQRRAQ